MAGLPPKPNNPIPKVEEATRHVYKIPRPKAVWKMADQVDEVRPQNTNLEGQEALATKKATTEFSGKKRKAVEDDHTETPPQVKRSKTDRGKSGDLEDGEVLLGSNSTAKSSDHASIRKQVEYYLSDTNLPSDNFLLSKMNGNPNNPIKLDIICSFKRMQQFESREVIVEALRSSETLLLIDNETKVQRKTPLPGIVPQGPSDASVHGHVSDRFRGSPGVGPGVGQVVDGTVKYDRHEKKFYMVDSVGQKTAWTPVAPQEHVNYSQVAPKPPTTEKIASSVNDTVDVSPSTPKPAATRKRKADREYSFRSTTVKYDHMRSRPHYDPEGRHIYDDEQPAAKRAKVAETSQIATSSEPPKKKNKHKRHSNAKTKEQTSIEMRLEDLIPHYRPKPKEVIAEEKALQEKEKKPPVTFMDLATEIRRNIWDKVFEDEAYNFKVKKQSSRDSWKLMLPTKPKSFGCLLINKTCSEEVQEEMYKSMKLEFEFGRLRPAAVREFVPKITEHKIGLSSERIFFIKKFGLQKVNLGRFKSAKEIISTHWTVDGDDKMDEDDYKNNRIDPDHVLNHPPSKEKLKGLKERRLWTDQEAATHRYEKHLAGECHPGFKPEIKDEKGEVIQKGEQLGKCIFDGACLNLEKTKMVVVVKYKFGCIKGRHARHKEVFYDLYPLLGDKLVQTRAPKSKFHKKCSKKGCQELDA